MTRFVGDVNHLSVLSSLIAYNEVLIFVVNLRPLIVIHRLLRSKLDGTSGLAKDELYKLFVSLSVYIGSLSGAMVMWQFLTCYPR
jgi:hypothetical protein